MKKKLGSFSVCICVSYEQTLAWKKFGWRPSNNSKFQLLPLLNLESWWRIQYLDQWNRLSAACWVIFTFFTIIAAFSYSANSLRYRLFETILNNVKANMDTFASARMKDVHVIIMLKKLELKMTLLKKFGLTCVQEILICA